MMSLDEFLLLKLSEESVEVSHAIHKALAFGLDDINPRTDGANWQRLVDEITDFLAVYEMLRDRESLQGIFSNAPNREAIEKKKKKVMKWLEYSRSRGKVE